MSSLEGWLTLLGEQRRGRSFVVSLHSSGV